MQIEVRPKKDMSALLVGSPPVHGLALAYLLSKAGIKTAFFSDGSMETNVQENFTHGHLRELGQARSSEPAQGYSSPHGQNYARRLRLGYASDFDQWLMQGRWQWVHIFTPNVSWLDQRIVRIARISRRLGLYLSLNVRIEDSNDHQLRQGVLGLLPLITYVGMAESDVRELYHSSDLGDVEFKLRNQGFRGVGVKIGKQCDHGYRVKTGQASHITLPGSLHGEAEWLMHLIQLQIERNSFLL